MMYNVRLCISLHKIDGLEKQYSRQNSEKKFGHEDDMPVSMGLRS